VSEFSDSEAPFQFSIVTAVYNVAPYLDDFIESIEGQTIPRDRFEVIAVDHGSTDESLAMLRAWEMRRPDLVTVIAQDNAGRAAARNAGANVARAPWVTFPQPDDVIGPGYLAQVASFLEENDPPSLIATNSLILDRIDGTVTDSHPLRRRFQHGARTRDIGRYPDHFHESVVDTFFLTNRLRGEGIRFDAKVGPSFEDGYFCAQYLLQSERPVIGFLPGAHYHRRIRTDSISSPQSALAHPQRYIRVLRHGLMNLLTQASVSTGRRHAPEWLQNLVLYELSWYFTSRDADAGAVAEANEEASDEIHGLMAEILGFISKHTIASFSVRRVTPSWRDFLCRAYEPGEWRATFGHVSRLDLDQRLVKVTYRFTGEPPVEELLSGGEVVTPTHSKTRDIAYFGLVLMRERVLWLSAGESIRLRLDGRDVNLQFVIPTPNHTLQPGTINRNLGPRTAAAARKSARHHRTFTDRALLRLARTRLVRHFFGDAWVLMDRITDAGDNGERLFRYLRRSRRRINAWFVVEGGSPDWHRLRKLGYRRVVPHGSFRWKLLMANCRHLISSHVSPPIMRPPALKSIMEPRWRFTFLQHGVIHTNLSRWLNIKPIDLFITSSSQEYVSIAGNHTPYTFTTKEVRLTGLPRWDRLRKIAMKTPDERRDLILVMPTWRSGLVPMLMPKSQRRAIDPAFYTSEYATSWMNLLKSPELLEACAQQNLTIGFLPHPNVQPALSGMDLPPQVLPLTFADNDVQELFARSAVFVTDYSSVAFDVAYINRPVVYFQFDRDTFLGGEHHGRHGYFEYERDGFGPVARTLDEAIRVILDTIRAGRSPSPTYQARIDSALPLRDGNCCKRVVDEIKQSTRRVHPAVAMIPIPTPLLSDRPLDDPSRIAHGTNVLEEAG